ncbi:hypothetical protein [Terrisporobacter hibernicus]|uniref:Uncharacterized protein n=1 Tax=Terrisporobacter hibernicus TaxID=2813371 RepID=A0AAX2ZES9_9FIRM|nr:hypothetical protein [Terrisporobacter hibernicus]UEL47551.1 hypothetical protein JW646_18315 [Terrisporobacter hibernicus]
MSNLENNIKDCIANELEKGVIEKVIAQQLEKCIEKSISDMFSWGGDVKKVVEEKIKSVMVPYLESYDYSKYITKLDSVLVDVLKNTALDNKRLLENFKNLMTSEDIPKVIKLTDIFDKWNEYCKKEIDKNDIEMDYDGGYINTRFTVEDVSNDWSIYKTYMVVFECEEDEDIKLEFSIQAYEPKEDTGFTSNYKNVGDLRNLRHLNDFEILMMRISKGYKNIIVDSFEESEEVFVENDEC